MGAANIGGPQLFVRSVVCNYLHQWLGTESNRRHADFQSAALPTELPSRTGSRPD